MPAPILRRCFQIAGPVRSARLSITALGLYEAHLNGRRIGEDYFRPGWTDYRVRLHYQTYDVTALIREGENVAAAVLEALPVADITIEEMGAEEVIRQLFQSREKGAS